MNSLKDWGIFQWDWEKNILLREGFDENQKARMFISRQTMEGLRITVYSVVECVKYLLASGMDYVLTEKFTQDLLELYFGMQRACGFSNDNPTRGKLRGCERYDFTIVDFGHYQIHFFL